MKQISVLLIYLSICIAKVNAQNLALTSDTSKFLSAVRLGSQLSLKSSQVDSLNAKSKILKQLLNENVGFDKKQYERDNLLLILGDEKYTSFLVVINKPKAIKASMNDWKELRHRNLISPTDSINVIQELTAYNLGKLVITERFGGVKQKLTPSLKPLSVKEPQSLKILKASQRADNVNPGFRM